MALSSDKDQVVRSAHAIVLGKATTAASFTGYAGSIVMISSAGALIIGGDTSGARALGVLRSGTETSPGIAGAVPSGTTLEYEYGHEVWFPIAAGSAAAFDGTIVGRDACITDDEFIGAASVLTNDVRLGRVVERETRNGVAGAWVSVCNFAPTI
jgi:hypothetical protein